MKKFTMSLVAGMVLASGAMASGVNEVKKFELEHAKKLHEQAKILKGLAEHYYHDIVEEFKGNYGKAWEKEKADLTGDVKSMQKAWIEASSNYEIIEGLVAGMPQTVKYDLILDAGIPASEGDEDVAPHNLDCGGKCKFLYV